MAYNLDTPINIEENIVSAAMFPSSERLKEYIYKNNFAAMKMYKQLSYYLQRKLSSFWK